MSALATLDNGLSIDALICIYALRDPRDGSVRYIGKAEDPAKRFRQHLQAGQLMRYQSRKNSWLKSLLTQGFEPELDILDRVPADRANAAECQWIDFYRDFEGDRLTNGTLGGDGGAITDPEARARVRAAHVGKVISLETRAKTSASLKAHCSAPAARERLRSISNGQPPVKTGEANHNAKLTEEIVREIRRLHMEGVSGVAIAALFEITPANVSLIVRNRAWRHVR